MADKKTQNISFFKKLPASFYVILGAIGWGVIGLFSRNLSALGLSVIQVTFSRAFVTLIGSGLVLLIFDREAFRIRFRDIWLFIGTGIVSIVLFNIFYLYTIEISTLSVAAILLYTAPSFVVILSAVFFHDKITLKILIALILATGGCILTTGIIGSGLSVPVIGIVTGVLSGFFYATYSIIGSVALKKYKTTTVVFYTFVFATIGLLPVSAPLEMIGFVQIPSALFNMIAIGVISTLLPYFLYSEGLSRMQPGRASILAFVEPITATLLGLFIFHETLSITNTIGILLIFISIVMLSIGDNKTDS